MRKSSYGFYLIQERFRYGLSDSDDNEMPAWIKLENDVNCWLGLLSSRMYQPLDSHTVSNWLKDRINNIENTRFRKYRDISPVLKNAIEGIVEEFVSIRTDLLDERMWKGENCLSDLGLERWEQAIKTISQYTNVSPDPEWRENWEKERVKPYCTRREAEELAIAYVREHFNIDLLEKDPISGKEIYSYHTKAKNGIFKMQFERDRKPGEKSDDTPVTVKVDMLTREVEEIK